MGESVVIFDCDGVLIDSEFVSSKFFAEALSEYGYSISIEECIKKFTGINEHACRKIIKEESGIEIPVDYWTQHEPDLLKVYESELVPLIQPVLQSLKALNVPRCVASNSPKSYILHCLGLTRQLDYFASEDIFTAQHVPRAKPAPDLFLFAAKQMGVEPENCIVVEDSIAGADAAIAAGMRVLLFVGGRHAQFPWYKKRMDRYNRPTLSTCAALLDTLHQELNVRNKT